MADIVPFRPRMYEAKRFVAGDFEASGTLCGHIDFVVPLGKTYSLSPDEALALIAILQGVREDVLNNSDPLHDPRIFDPLTRS